MLVPTCHLGISEVLEEIPFVTSRYSTNSLAGPGWTFQEKPPAITTNFLWFCSVKIPHACLFLPSEKLGPSNISCNVTVGFPGVISK